MKKYLLGSILFLGLFALNSCSKDGITPESQNTSLELTIQDETGNNIHNAGVKLFLSETDMDNRTNQIGPTLFSDIYGKVTFKDLSAITHYWLAEKDCKNNMKGLVSSNSDLVVNTNNTALITISTANTGVLKLENLSGNTLHVKINDGAIEFDMDGNASRYIYDMPIGMHLIEVGPLDNSFNELHDVNLLCGQTAIVTYPN